VQSPQLPTESQVLEDELRPAVETTDQPAEEMSERHDHGKNFSGKDASSFAPVIHFVGVGRFGETQGLIPAVDHHLFTAHPIIQLSGLLQHFEMVRGKSVNVWSQEPTKVHADTKRIAIELERNAATKIKLEIQITDRFVVNTTVEAVVTDEIRRAG
jgi:hypothetical protein